MELTRKEEYRNKKISAAITIFAFLVMLAFLIFKNIITSTPSFSTSLPNEMTIGISNGNDDKSGSDNKKIIPVSEKKQKSVEEKIVTAPNNEITLKSTAEIVAHKYKRTLINSSTETSPAESELPGRRQDQGNTISDKAGDSKIGFVLEKRSVIISPVFTNDTKEEGKVIVEIIVNKNGEVIDANPNGRGTTTNNSLLKAKAKQMALATKFSSNQKLEEQHGNITIIFSFN